MNETMTATRTARRARERLWDALRAFVVWETKALLRAGMKGAS